MVGCVTVFAIDHPEDATRIRAESSFANQTTSGRHRTHRSTRFGYIELMTVSIFVVLSFRECTNAMRIRRTLCHSHGCLELLRYVVSRSNIIGIGRVNVGRAKSASSNRQPIYIKHQPPKDLWVALAGQAMFYSRPM